MYSIIFTFLSCLNSLRWHLKHALIEIFQLSVRRTLLSQPPNITNLLCSLAVSTFCSYVIILKTQYFVFPIRLSCMPPMTYMAILLWWSSQLFLYIISYIFSHIFPLMSLKVNMVLFFLSLLYSFHHIWQAPFCWVPHLFTGSCTRYLHVTYDIYIFNDIWNRMINCYCTTNNRSEKWLKSCWRGPLNGKFFLDKLYLHALLDNSVHLQHYISLL